MFTLDRLAWVVCQQLCTLQELEVKAGRAECRGKDSPEDRKAKRDVMWSSAERDAQPNLATHLEVRSFNAPGALC